MGLVLHTGRSHVRALPDAGQPRPTEAWDHKEVLNVTAAGDVQAHVIDGEMEAPLGLNSDIRVRVQ